MTKSFLRLVSNTEIEVSGCSDLSALISEGRKLKHDFLVCAKDSSGTKIFETVSAPGKAFVDFLASAINNFQVQGKTVWNVYSLDQEIPEYLFK